MGRGLEGLPAFSSTVQGLEAELSIIDGEHLSVRACCPRETSTS